jgi:RNA polymerase sigma factor (sigma-70 family)
MEFEPIMRENGPLIYTLAVRLTGNPADGQDLAQETFVKAYEKFEQFRGDSSAATWLYRICVNLWKNRVRYEKRRFFWQHDSLDRGEKDKSAPPAREIPSTEPAHGSTLERAFRRSLVNDALEELDIQDRAILILREMDDKSYDEIAAVLEIPIGTVKSRLARGRERLRLKLLPHLKDLT